MLEFFTALACLVGTLAFGMVVIRMFDKGYDPCKRWTTGLLLFLMFIFLVVAWSSWMAECQPEIDNYIQNLSDKGMHDGKDTSQISTGVYLVLFATLFTIGALIIECSVQCRGEDDKGVEMREEAKQTA
mmetsp:Transcript_16987/g.32235  ORF Transcript_16987/g.32235 Transcript_16987/m.32235 type:complete len:129 (-) Transcript_16987:235-621(-)